MSYKKQELLTLREHLSSSPVFSVGSVLLIFLDLCVVLLRSEFRIVMSITISGSFLPPVICKKALVLFTVLVCILVCFSSSCVPYVASSSGLSFVSLPLRYSLTFIS